MAGKIVSPCRAPSCPLFALPDERFCTDHIHEYKISRTRERHRKKVRDPFYGTLRWKRKSLKMRKKYPVCQKCKVQFTQVVHHIKPVKQYPELAFEDSNLLCLCHTCHNRIEGRIRAGDKTC